MQTFLFFLLDLGSKWGRHIGVQPSAVLNVSDEFTKLMIRCTSEGWRRCFLLTRTKLMS